MNTPTPTAKPTPAELADWLKRRAEVDTGFAHKLKPASACIRTQAALIRELSAKVAACEALADKMEGRAQDYFPGTIQRAILQHWSDELRAALSRPPANRGAA